MLETPFSGFVPSLGGPAGSSPKRFSPIQLTPSEISVAGKKEIGKNNRSVTIGPLDELPAHVVIFD